MQNQITILGSGTGMSSFYKPFDFRYPSGYLVQYKGENLLLDCSEGMRARLEKIKVDFFSINNIFISHFHPDHFDIISFLQSVYIRCIESGEKKTIKVFGPKDIGVKFEKIWDLLHEDGHYSKTYKSFVDVKFFDYFDKQKIIVNKNITITPFKTIHGSMDAYSLRLSVSDKKICYSGDSSFSEGLVKAAENVDLFICESLNSIGSKPDKSHLSPGEAGKIAKTAKAKHLILTHYDGEHTDREMKEDVRKSGFTGEITIGKDFQTFKL